MHIVLLLLAIVGAAGLTTQPRKCLCVTHIIVSWTVNMEVVNLRIFDVSFEANYSDACQRK